MRNLSIGAATAGLLIALLSGCASSPVVMRGQSPEGMSRTAGGTIQRAGHTNYDQYYYDMGMDPSVQNLDCGPDGCGREFCAPPQHYKFQYVVPQGLNYPPQNAMPGVMQYPYYTVKGPDCFFHQ
ncbi:MAG: hypothetical protein V4719_20680 [Planctomycetota bacterium]|jgi:hypothetical protein